MSEVLNRARKGSELRFRPTCAPPGARENKFQVYLLRGRLADMGREVCLQVVPEGWPAWLPCLVRVQGAASLTPGGVGCF